MLCLCVCVCGKTEREVLRRIGNFQCTTKDVLRKGNMKHRNNIVNITKRKTVHLLRGKTMSVEGGGHSRNSRIRTKYKQCRVTDRGLT